MSYESDMKLSGPMKAKKNSVTLKKQSIIETKLFARKEDSRFE